MKTLKINEKANDYLLHLAAQHGISKAQLVDAVMHYLASRCERSGSWEANCEFDPNNYYPPEWEPERLCPADKWW